MKKRRGFIRHEFDDGTFFDRPVDPDRKTIPNRGGGFTGEDGCLRHGDGERWWRERPEDAKAENEWWRVQDKLDTLASKHYGKKSRGRKGSAEDRHEKWIAEATKMLETRGKSTEAAELSINAIATILANRDDETAKPDTIARILREAGLKKGRNTPP